MTDLKARCCACHKNFATKENYEHFYAFWCDACVEKARKEVEAEENEKED